MATPSEPLTIGMVEARNVKRCTALDIHVNPAKRSRWELILAKTWGAGSRAEWEIGNGLCKGCGQPIDATPTCSRLCELDLQFPSTTCDACMELVREHYNQRPASTNDVAQTPVWDEDCPPRFKDALIGDLPATVDAMAYKRVIAWRPGDGKGLALKGPSGAGKTTAYWSLARELEREGFNPKCLTAIQLGRILSEAARDIKEVSWLYRSRVLMVDDLGKEKATPAMAALFWEVLDQRYGLGHPLIITTRFSGDQLRQRFGEECLGDDIIRRLNELCVGVSFKLTNQTTGPQEHAA